MDMPPKVSTAGDETTIVDVADLDSRAFAELYRRVLAPSFTEDELIDEETLRSYYLSGVPEFFGCVTVLGAEPIAVALAEHHPASGLSLLNYLAVDPGIRQGGHGGRLLRHSVARWVEAVHPVAILAEVEDPRCHAASAHGDPAARLRFYERLGATLLPLPYFQPALGPGLNRIPDMLLINLHATPAGIPGDALRQFLDDYVAAGEGADARDHEPVYLALRQRIGEWPGSIPEWSMSRLAEIPPLAVRETTDDGAR